MEETMLKRILLALDGSENAERALWWVTKVAGREKAQVVLFRAVDTSTLEPEFIPSTVQDALNYLQRMETEVNQAGIPAKVLVRQGKPAEMIVKVAIEERCDLILMATRGGSKVKRWAIGGVTEKVLRMSPIPVLPVRAGPVRRRTTMSAGSLCRWTVPTSRRPCSTGPRDSRGS
jgi:nucleotide-binding universal stress UspA family protein